MTLSTILGLAILILLLLFILLGLLLLVPIDLEGRVSRGGDRPETRMEIGWLFGRLHKDVSRGAVEREPSKEGKKQAPKKDGDDKEEEDKETKGGRSSARIALEVLRTEGFLGNLAHLLRGLFGAFKAQFLRIDLVVGLPDPSDTAEAVGLLWAVLIPLETVTPVRAKIAPSFSEETLAGSAEGKLRIWPYKTVPPLARFLLAPSTLRAGWRVVRARRGKG
ncbi:MAG: hypothetical protein APR56_00825 [Methanosaeta sp. SDB]|nr:MAG: hypothetical protein APR56_00825 [Methanosaeta sp. SDB]